MLFFAPDAVGYRLTTKLIAQGMISKPELKQRPPETRNLTIPVLPIFGE